MYHTVANLSGCGFALSGIGEVEDQNAAAASMLSGHRLAWEMSTIVSALTRVVSGESMSSSSSSSSPSSSCVSSSYSLQSLGDEIGLGGSGSGQNRLREQLPPELALRYCQGVGDIGGHHVETSSNVADDTRKTNCVKKTEQRHELMHLAPLLFVSHAAKMRNIHNVLHELVPAAC